MSRSFKKNPIIKDKSKYRQELSHHIVRMNVRNTLNSNLEYDEMLFPTSRAIELVDPWDVSDWKMRLPTSGYFYYNYRQGRLIYNKVTKEDIRRYTNK